CINKAVCEICGTEYGDFAAHIPEADDGDCTTDIHCSICGAVTENTAHTGGEATCINKAVCEICGTEYGDFAAHIPEADDGDCTTDIHCSICGAVTENTAHTGGEATCTNKAICEICGTEYGELAAHIPEADDGDCTTDIHCSSCGAVTTPGNATHTGGEATCTEKAKCENCGTEYGEFAAHIPEADDGDCTTDILCSSCGTVTTPGNATHTGGEATCINKAVCEICGTEYGDFAAHIPEADDGDCTTDIHCSICGAVTTPGNDENKGNSAITLPSVEAASGETQVSFAVSIRNNPGITGLTITVQYSSEFLTLTDAESGNALEALTFTEPSNLNSGCTFLWDSEKIEDKDIKNGEMLILTFNVSSSAPEGVYSIILNVSAFDNDLNPVSLIITGGKIVVKNN
ncbi:MAG: hypothetical protein IJD74_05925, partial [Clostridia bacterium]|nr:hypothetical protein [Clostridia bacterium]